MADTNTIKYVSLGNLERFQTLNKQYIDAQDAALKSNLEGQLDTVAGAVDAEATRAKGEEAKNAAAAQAAKDAADAAQDHSEALAAKVGEVAEGKTVVGMIQDVIDSAYDDTEVRGLISNLDTNKADKTQVATDISTAVAAETSAREAAVAGVQGSVDTLSQTHATDKKALEDAIALKANQTAVDGLAGRMDTAEADIENIEKDYLKAADKTELEGKIKVNTDAIGVLNGEGEGSVKKAIDDAINKFATDVTNDDVVNSFKELVDWAAEHGGEAAEMAEAIQGNTTAIGELETFIGSLPEGATVSTVIAYIEKLVNDEKARAEGAEGDLSDRLDAVELMLGDGDGSVSDQISDAAEGAKNAAIEAAAQDATTKANTAESNAKSHADTEIAKDRARLDALEDDTHTHSNKALLDSYTQSETDLADAIAKKHEHTNKAELDLIQTGDKAKWDAAEQNAKDFATGLNTTMDGRVAELEAFVDGVTFCENSDIDALFA